MKIHTRFLTIAAAALLPLTAIAADDAAADKCGCCSPKADAAVKTAFATPPLAPLAADSKLSEADIAFLASYENIRAALAGDDFEAAKKAAAGLDGGEPVAKAKSIADARVAFKALSAKAIAKAKGYAGFYVAHCPMVKGGGADWLTTKKKIENPYFGSQMLNCGSIKN